MNSSCIHDKYIARKSWPDNLNTNSNYKLCFDFFQMYVVKPRPRRFTRREKWPIHLGLFLLYVFIQLVTSSTTSRPASFSTEPPAKDQFSPTEKNENLKSTISVPEGATEKSMSEKEVTSTVKDSFISKTVKGQGFLKHRIDEVYEYKHFYPEKMR